MSPANSGQRNRGVRASRAKLAHALTAAGFKTQAALAERIADIEELDNAPKDVVSRVFRELPVDPATLERVARALGVDAYSLYKTADEDTLLTDAAEHPTGLRPRISLALVAAVVVLALVLGIRWWFEPQTHPDTAVEARRPGSTWACQHSQ